MSIIIREKLQIKDIKEITVAIDDLDDIFTDFDPRPVQLRALSEDFLGEIKKFYKEAASGKLMITFLAPIELKRNLQKNAKDQMIFSHLKQIFKRKHLTNKKRMGAITRRGIFYIAFGMTLLLTLTMLAYYKIISTFALEIIGVVLMPLGWFGIWEGFSKLVDVPFKLKEETEMFDKLSKAQYT